MRVLLTEGSGLTSRQVAGRLGALGHHVGVLSSDGLGLTRFTRATGAWHRVRPFGADPLGWLDEAMSVYAGGAYDVLLPTQEQVTVLAAHAARLRANRIVTAVPDFAAVRAVQDKVSAWTTLDDLRLPQPQGAVIHDDAELARWSRFPVFVKRPIGTATSGVHLVRDRAGFEALRRSGSIDASLPGDGVLLQAPVDGPLLMCQSVFRAGQLVAFHANTRERLGARGGASHKVGVARDDCREILERLGTALRWHGALSADVIVTDAGPSVIDVNPRLVEPGNALRDGLDLTRTLMDVALDRPVAVGPSQTGARTHQLLLAVLGAAEQGRGRRGVARELIDAVRQRHSYAGSTEELTPWRRDRRALVPVAAASAVTLVHPPAWQWFASGSVSNYALTPAAWQTICRSADGLTAP
ncbi:MAG: ATP-grasp domain-containing protein [Actinobacteria bacterium]|nr:ATP-grasp domain-containing protein [Actinomycetota bacterium]